jgi:uncharacterized protein (DUF2147 family)
MKGLLTLAAFLLASSAAQAQYTFQYDGYTIHIDPDRGVISIPGLYDNSGRKSKRTRNSDHDTGKQCARGYRGVGACSATLRRTGGGCDTKVCAGAPAVAVPLLAGAPAPPSTPAAVRDPNSPVGVWLTEEKEGKIRVEQCGTNLCGYSLDAKSNQNGEQILINMKPGKNMKWSGRIVDPNSGSTYDSTIALKSPDTLRVQGCAFGGMFCGGQTWTRAN